MSELVALAAMAMLVAALLWLAGVRGLVFAVAGIALLSGALAFERLAIVDSPSAPTPQRGPQGRSLADTRHAFTGRFTRGENWLTMADSMAARGNTADAAGILIAAVKQHPRDYALWTGLGTMLVEHGGGLNPGAQLAFDRAIALAPAYPAPRFFYGLARQRSGDRAEAIVQWKIVLDNAPADASWRPLVETRIKATEAAPN